MKKLFILITGLMLIAETSMAISACNYSEEQEFIRDPLWSANKTFVQPKGSCDLLGSMGNSQVKACAQLAQKEGYTCFQVGRLEQRNPVWGGYSTTKLCYACF